MMRVLLVLLLTVAACSDGNGDDGNSSPDTGDDTFLPEDAGDDAQSDAPEPDTPGDDAGDDAEADTPDQGDTPDVDDQAPTVSLTAPQDGLVVEEAFDALVEASDNVGVVSVSFFVDDEEAPRATFTEPPFAATIEIEGLQGGNHNLRAVATDAAGNEGRDTAVFVIDGPPFVRFTAPGDGDTIAGPTYDIRLEVGDDVELDDAEVFINGDSLGDASDGSIRWEIPFVRADYELRAVATDAGGQTAEAAIQVSVDHPATLELQRCVDDECGPVPAELHSLPVTLAANFADDDEHDNLSVVFTIDGQIIDEAVGPFVIEWDAGSVAPGTHTLGARAFAGDLLAETEVEITVLAPRTCQEACRVTLACRAEICGEGALPSEPECLADCALNDWDLETIVEAECGPLNGAFCRGGGRDVEGCDCEAYPDPTCAQVCSHLGSCLPEICGDLLPIQDLFEPFCVIDCDAGRIDLNLIDAQCPMANEAVCEVNDIINGLCMCPEVERDCEAACTRAADACLGRICPSEELEDFHAACVTQCEDETLDHDLLARGECRALDDAVCGGFPALAQACECPEAPEGCDEACAAVGQCVMGECNGLPAEVLSGFCMNSCQAGGFSPLEIPNLDCTMQLETLCQADAIVPNLCMCPPAREANTGAPCVGDDDCAALDVEGVCLSGAGFDDGYCSAIGCTGSYQCGAGAVCLDPVGIPICAASCDPFEGTGCREGYACARVDGLRGACTPQCETDADCGQFFQCDEARGHCTP